VILKKTSKTVLAHIAVPKKESAVECVKYHRSKNEIPGCFF